MSAMTGKDRDEVTAALPEISLHCDTATSIRMLA
jgi:hypothetical protein